MIEVAEGILLAVAVIVILIGLVAFIQYRIWCYKVGGFYWLSGWKERRRRKGELPPISMEQIERRSREQNQ